MKAYEVPFVAPGLHYRLIQEEVDAAIRDCLEHGDLIMRKHLSSYEEEFAAFVGTKHAIGVNSGYHALHLSLLAADIGQGDEVITVAHTFVATISAIVHVGAEPVLVDVGEDYNVDIEGLERAISPRTKAILPVHLNGRICDMGRIMELASAHGLVVIEDAAQAAGARFQDGVAGSFGLTGCFSHYPFKILGCFGDGGIITTNDDEVALAARRLRFNGEDRETGEYHFHGYTCLLDNVQAAVLSVKLRYLPAWIERRRQLAERYRTGLGEVAALRLPHFAGPHHDVFQNYVVRTERRDELVDHLTHAGIETLVHWPKPVWEHKALGLGDHDLPETSSICDEVVSLPMYPELTDEQVDFVSGSVRDFFG